MTILESLRDKKISIPMDIPINEHEQNLLDIIEEYDLALENALLKLKNRGVQIADLKNKVSVSKKDNICYKVLYEETKKDLTWYKNYYANMERKWDLTCSKCKTII